MSIKFCIVLPLAILLVAACVSADPVAVEKEAPEHLGQVNGPRADEGEAVNSVDVSADTRVDCTNTAITQACLGAYGLACSGCFSSCPTASLTAATAAACALCLCTASCTAAFTACIVPCIPK